jgi:hypothetical protein
MAMARSRSVAGPAACHTTLQRSASDKLHKDVSAGDTSSEVSLGDVSCLSACCGSGRQTVKLLSAGHSKIPHGTERACPGTVVDILPFI